MHLCFMLTWTRRVQEWPRLLWAMEVTVIFVASVCSHFFVVDLTKYQSEGCKDRKEPRDRQQTES